MKEVTVMNRSRLMLLVAVAVLLLPSCSKDNALPVHQGSASSAVASDPGTITPVAQPVTATTPAMAAIAAPPATAPAVAPGTVIASTDGEYPGATVNVTELKRTSGETVTLKFNIANAGTEPVAFGYNFAEGDYNTVSGVYLLDPVGKKKYFVVRDAESKCVCSRDMTSKVDPGSRMNLWAKFPAPGPEVQKVTVVIPHFTPMDDVPIS